MPSVPPVEIPTDLWLFQPESSLHPHNAAALSGWHRAHGGGITLGTESGQWNHTAVVDRNLLQPEELRGSAPSLAMLKARAANRIRAVAFPGIRPPSALFLDRDGTMIVDRDYLRDPAQVTLLEGALDGLQALQASGIPLVVVTNQSGVGRGWIAPEELDAVHRELERQLAGNGVALAGIYSCPHRDDEGCECRKPGTGLVLQAARDLGLELDGAALAGDKAADIILARRLGMTPFLVTSGYGATTLMEGGAEADYVVDSLAQVAGICLHPAGRAVPAPLPEH